MGRQSHRPQGWSNLRSPPRRTEKHHTHGSPPEDPRAPLLVTTPMGFRMRRYEQSFYARGVMMSFRVLPALPNLHFTKQMIVFSLSVVLQTTPAFLKVKGF